MRGAAFDGAPSFDVVVAAKPTSVRGFAAPLVIARLALAVYRAKP